MFRVVSPTIIRSSSLYLQHLALVWPLVQPTVNVVGSELGTLGLFCVKDVSSVFVSPLYVCLDISFFLFFFRITVEVVSNFRERDELNWLTFRNLLF
jgi:hypothetical protein